MFDRMLTRGSGEDRAVSVAISHALSIAITTVLLSGLLVGSGSFVESQEAGVADEQINEIGHNLVTQVNTLERLRPVGPGVTTVELDYPRRIVDSYRYEFELVDGGDDLLTGQQGIIIRVDGLDRTRGFDISDDTEINTSRTDGPTVALTLCETDTDGDAEITFEQENC